MGRLRRPGSEPGNEIPGGTVKIRTVLATGLVATALAVTALPAAAQSSEKPTATEIGVTPTEVRIAVVADVDNTLAPALFKGSVDGVKAGVEFVNSKAGGGGVAGRKLVVDFLDSHLSATDSRNATIQACQNNLAMVGTMVLFLNTVEDIVNCKDKAGAVTGLPDIASTAVGSIEACSPMTFSVLGNQTDCATITQNPQTYYGNQGQSKYLLKKYGKLSGPMIVGSDTKDAKKGGSVLALTNQAAGVTMNPNEPVGKSGRAPQSEYTETAVAFKQNNSNYFYSSTAVGGTLSLIRELKLQGVDTTKIVMDATSVYGNKVVADNPDLFEGMNAALQYLPVDEGKYNKNLAAFEKYMKAANAPTDQFSVYGFSAVIAFRDAVNATVAKHGVNGLTRANLIEGIKTLTDFDAGGMMGAHSFKTARTTACFVAVKFVKGTWVRQYPKKPGTMDCDEKNQVVIKANLLGL